MLERTAALAESERQLREGNALFAIARAAAKITTLEWIVASNTLNFSEALAGVILNMSGVTGDGSSGQGTASDGLGGTDVLRNMIFFVGSDFSDSFLGSSAFVFEQFEGGLGNDTIDGGAITDFIFTRDGNRANYTNATSP